MEIVVGGGVMGELMSQEALRHFFESVDAETLSALQRIAERAAPVETFKSGRKKAFKPFKELEKASGK